VQRHDRDFGPEVTPAQDSHEEKLRRIKEHLSRPILAGELNGPVRLYGNALRKHADLDSIPEHPFITGLRELREAKGQ